MYVGSELMSALKFACWVERGGLNPRAIQCRLCGPGIPGTVWGMSSLAPHTFAERPLGSPSSGLVLAMQEQARPAQKTDRRQTHSPITLTVHRNRERMAGNEARHVRESNKDLI